jgi:enterochelin esterase-like enzyme
MDSPRIARLAHSLSGPGARKKLADFWIEVKKSGTPLVEKIPDDRDHLLVTFLWKGNERTTKHVLIPLAPAVSGDLKGSLMKHLPNSDVWYKSYRLPADTRTTYALAPNASLTPFGDIHDIEERLMSYKSDPLNPRRFIETHIRNAETGEKMVFPASILELPKARPKPWLNTRRKVPKGTLAPSRMRSDVLHNERRIWVYTPNTYSPKDKGGYGLLVLMDGVDYLEYMSAVTMLDNLIADNVIPPLVAVFVDVIDTKTRYVELSCHQPFIDFLTKELLPWVESNYNVTRDRRRRIICGLSLGGLCATYAGFRRSDLFENVIVQSGAYSWKGISDNPNGEDEWLVRRFESEPKKPLRFHLVVGQFERSTPGLDMLTANRNMRDVLWAKGYEVDYSEYHGAHDYICWEETMPGALIFATKSWK